MKKPKYAKVEEPKIYVVRWMDAWASLNTYHDDHGNYTPMVMKDIGFVCEMNDESIVLAQSVSESGALRNLTVIPWEFVIDMKELV